MSNPGSKPLTVMRRSQVERLTGLSRSGIYELMSKGEFPKPIPLSTRSVGWLGAEVEDWIRSRIDLRSGPVSNLVIAKEL